MEWLLNLGYLGLFIGSALAGSVFPLSSDVLMIGMLAAGGNPILCLFVASIGNALGAASSYVLGWFGKWEWLEKGFKVSRAKLEGYKKNVDKYGLWIALFSWLPFIGALGVITLGFYKVKPSLTMLLILVGCFARFSVWTILYLYFF